MNSKKALTVSAIAFGIFGSGWLVAPEVFYKYWGIVPDTGNTMGHRYGAFMLALMTISWLARALPNTQAKRAILIGSLVGWVITDALSLYGALVLGLNAWVPTAVELTLVAAFVWVLFVRPEPVSERGI
jgi:hypothetical protein